MARPPTFARCTVVPVGRKWAEPQRRRGVPLRIERLLPKRALARAVAGLARQQTVEAKPSAVAETCLGAGRRSACGLAMSTIPEDMQERVHELALVIVNAMEANDEALGVSCRQALRDYFDAQAALGRFHPFLTESVADYTEDAKEAARLYALAIEQSRGFPDEPLHTKRICLAERLLELGRTEQAEAFLRDGRTEAVRLGDQAWIDDADRGLRQLNG